MSAGLVVINLKFEITNYGFKLTRASATFAEVRLSIRVVFDAIRQLMALPGMKEKRIGFIVSERAARYGRSTGTGRG